ncbi:MAG: hypothetical protein WD715_01590 [Dongiaceae bacterium]
MRWLDRFKGRKKPAEDFPPGFHSLLDNACEYISVCFMSGFIQTRREAVDQIVNAQTAAGIDRAAAMRAAERSVDEHPSYCRGDPMGSVAMLIQFAHQLGFYVERPSDDIAYGAGAVFVIKCLNLPKLATSREFSEIFTTQGIVVTELLDHCRTNAGTRGPLDRKWSRLSIGIVVGNRMAQEFFAQLHANSKPTPSVEMRQFFSQHLILRDRAMDGDDIHPISSADFVPDVRQWLTGEAPTPVKIAIVTPPA